MNQESHLGADLGGEQSAEFPAGLEVLLAGRAGDGDRRPDRAPLQAGRDRLHRAHRAAGVAGAVHVQAVGPPPGRLKAALVGAIGHTTVLGAC